MPLREIALKLHLSHQRVHQLVVATSGPRRRWTIKRSRSTGLACTFCCRDRVHVAKLVAGPNVFICDQCVNSIERFDTVHVKSTLRCSFCGKPRSQVPRMFAAENGQMCGECLDLAAEIIADS
ncbi:MAG: hypothetical protein JO165_01045 [Candidatus Eremiobacteraeota bacterium]|nr:hypothetical protein [Candidatus Eremiobacteraeota bacterium]